MATGSGIDSIMKEGRKFPPPADFARQAHISTEARYRELYDRSIKDPDGFWLAMARENHHWFKAPTRGLEWKSPDLRCFADGTTNLSFNCLDRQIELGRGDHTAILFEGEPGDVRKISYRELRDEVCRLANVLKKLGVKKGDRITLYMPMIPELAIAMLACARIGAPHSVIFGGFTSQAIADRLQDAGSHVVITADGGWRRGKIVPLKENVDAAADLTGMVKTVIVYERITQSRDRKGAGGTSGAPSAEAAQFKINMKSGRDHWWHDLMKDASTNCPAEPLDAEHMLYLLYTSGSTGKPKGILHTTGGYMVYTALSAKYVFDLKPDDVFWCTADIGWVTGHSYVVYGILQNGVTSVMYEGAPNQPDWDRFWAMIEKHKVTKFYTAPTAIRAFMRQGREFVDKHDLSSLKLLGTVGEPINPEAWIWYHTVVGKERCPIVDTWWQTETGGILLTPLPGVTSTKPGSATRPFFGIDPAIMSKEGKVAAPNEGGFLVIRKPWPAMLRGIWGDPERYQRQYWDEIPGVYFTGDSSRCDEDGYFWIMGRVDDVIKVAGHRLGTAEVESALVSHPKVAEAAVVGFPDELTGEAIAAFVALRSGNQPSEALETELKHHVAAVIGAIARPKALRFTDALPKTRSGKIMRRLLKELATKGRVDGDLTTLEDFSVIAKLRDEA
ncbi:MAG: Acetyl-coenzyme A synthetase [Phycisphaerae bacterium]|nr:Acetyl-coenzyme A synthetase [Phycisphaerae bacterium]